MFLSEEERSEPEQRVAAAMVRLLVTAGNFYFENPCEQLKASCVEVDLTLMSEDIAIATSWINQRELLTLIEEAVKKFTAINAGFDFGRMLATAAHNLEQLELEMRTTLLGKMAGQVLSKTFLILFFFENVSLTKKRPMSRAAQWLIRQCEPRDWLLASSSCMETAPSKSL